MEATVKRFASLLAALLTFLMINSPSANAAAPDQELLHNGHVDAAHTEGDQATDRPTTQVLGDSNDLNDRYSTDISPSPDADDSTVLDHGHADIFRVGSAPDGGIDLKLKEDVTGDGALHTPENVLLKIKDSALTDIPASLPGAPQGYVLPLTQNQDLLWPGWETSDVKRNGFDSVKITVSNVKGPGKVHLFSQGSFGAVQPLLDGNATELPGTITVAQPSHVHANWVFGKTGVYTMTVQATAHRSGKKFQTTPHTYTWVVGDTTPLPEPWGKLTPPPTPTPSPTPSVTPTPSLSPEPRPTSSITPPKTSVAPKPTPAQSQKRSLPREQTRKPVLKPQANKTPCTQRLVLDHGHSDVFRVGSAAKNGLDLKVKEDVTGEGVLHAPESVLLAVKDSALTTIPRGYPGAPKGYLLPMTQNQNLLWPGWETFDVKRNGFSDVKINVRNVKGPGKVHLFSQSSFGNVQTLLDGGSHTMPGTITVKQPSHVHANWVFSDPGAQTISVDVRGTDGTGVKHSYSTKLRFAVGDTGSANEARAVGSSPSVAASSLSTAAATNASAPTTTENSFDDSGAGTLWGPGIMAGALIIGIIIAALVGRSRSKTLRDEVWNKEHTDSSEAHRDFGNESR